MFSHWFLIECMILTHLDRWLQKIKNTILPSTFVTDFEGEKGGEDLQVCIDKLLRILTKYV